MDSASPPIECERSVPELTLPSGRPASLESLPGPARGGRGDLAGTSSVRSWRGKQF